MKLLIFGSTGGTGRELVSQALENGYTVVAFARDPAKLADLAHEHLTVVQGDVLDREAVAKAVAGQDAVVSAIGAGAKRSTLREEGTRNIVEAMQQAGTRRLVSLSSLGVGDSRANLPLWIKYVIVPMLLRHAFADHERQEQVIIQSNLDWTLVRPPQLTNGPRTGNYRHGFAPTDKGVRMTISRADVAEFMLKQMSDETYVRKVVGVAR